MLPRAPHAVSLTVNRNQLRVPAGTSVAAAVFLSGATAFRRSVSGEPRAALCGMGVCLECRVTIDGFQHVKSCQLECSEGMEIATDDFS
jgi:sarcosine oxidase subunit alpha